jgi:hypothetical protein
VNQPNDRLWSDIERKLRSERSQFTAPPGFTERVLANLPARMDTFEAKQAIARPFRSLRLAIGLATAACIAFVLLPFLPRSPQLPEAISANTEQTPPSLPITLPSVSAAQVEAWTARLDEPLQKELNNVISDTRQAIQFVASNFIPEDQSR